MILVAAATLLMSSGFGWYDVTGDGVDRTADCLVSLGWHGDPNDGRDRIWAPLTAIEWCKHYRPRPASPPSPKY